MPKTVKRTVIGIKTETTQGSAATLTATDFILAEDVDITPAVDLIERNYYRSSFSPLASISGKRNFDITFKTELKGSGTAGTAYAPLGAGLIASGMVQTVSTGTSVTYAPTSAASGTGFYGAGNSATIEIFMDGVKHIAAGCLGSWKLSGEAAKIGMVEFTFKGVYATPADVAFPTQTYNSTLPPILVSSALSVQSLSAICSKFELDYAAEVSERVDTRSSTGLLGFLITGRNPSGSFDPEFESVATHDFFTKLLTNTEGAFTIAFGGTAGNIVTIAGSKAQYNPFKYGDRNGIRTLDVPLRFNQSSGDDELTIVMT